MDEQQYDDSFRTRFSVAIIGLLHDLTQKPPSCDWSDYLIATTQKDYRYVYLAILAIFIVLAYILAIP